MTPGRAEFRRQAGEGCAPKSLDTPLTHGQKALPDATRIQLKRFRGFTGSPSLVSLKSVSYTHLDVYKRQLMAFGASENTIDYGVAYMNIYAIGTIFVPLTLGMNAFITAQGFAKTGMLSVLLSRIHI